MSGLIAANTNLAPIFGTITPPQGVKQYDAAVGGNDPIGLILFASNLIKIVTVVAGLVVFINIIMAGIEIIGASGDAGKMDKAKDKIVQSVIGLAIIVASYVIIALLGLIFFGDPTYILNPNISGPVVPTN